MSIWWSLHLRREAASVPLARRLLLGTMETAGVDPDVCYDLSLALSEACANAVEHGDGVAEEYRVTAFIDGDTCRIEVTDSGPGFHDRSERLDRSDGAHRSDGPGRSDGSGRPDGPSRSDGPVRSTGPGSGSVPGTGPGSGPGTGPHDRSPSSPRTEPAPLRRHAPAPAQAEHGRGLFLIEALTDQVRYRNRTGRRGAVVSFDKVLKWREGALLQMP
ncbi:ATP-binding protein [Streptomyces sclerotialus]|uniref:ATP-binding protein n=1 Tax=Streptomyces sclerotialus TaxID=1957 RepID=UPI0004C6E585